MSRAALHSGFEASNVCHSLLILLVVQGVARSMPTGAALDRVAKELGVPFFETPTGASPFTLHC